MTECLPLAPRYRLDDEQAWLIGIDPLRRYWLSVNGDGAIPVILPGLSTDDFDQFRQAMLAFRAMVAGETLQFPTATGASLVVQCIAQNCFAVEAAVNGYHISHLFDRETLDALLMTAHPDWRCAPHHRELGRQMLAIAWDKSAAAARAA